MPFIARFRAIDEKDKAAAIRTLIEAGTPSFDFFYFVALSVAMATLGLLADSPSIVIGSMLIAPLLYPILGIAMGLVMSNADVLGRSIVTLTKSIAITLAVSITLTIFFGDGLITSEIASRINPSLIHFLVALVAGASVAFALARPEWSETLPGVAISVALIPPLSVVGVGIAMLNIDVVTGSIVMFLMNLFGIIFAAMVTFSLMNLYEKQSIADSTIKKEDERQQKEAEAVAAVIDKEGKNVQNER